jgi:hypothetical protein
MLVPSESQSQENAASELIALLKQEKFETLDVDSPTPVRSE